MSVTTGTATVRSAASLFEFRTVTFDVPERVIDEILDAAADVAAHASCHEPGTRLFSVLQDRQTPTRFLIAAVFDDEAAARAHSMSAPARRLATCLLASGVRPEPVGWSAVAGI